MTVLRRRWPESHGPVWTADRSRRFESPGAGHARAHDQDFFFFFLLFFLLLFFFFGTFLPFLRASERPIAMACLRLFTLPPFPPLPLFSLPFFCFFTAFFTSLPALLEYLRAMLPPCFVRQRTRRFLVPERETLGSPGR